MTKRIILTITGLLLLTGIIGGIKALQIGRMIDAGAQFVPPPETVTTAMVRSETWEASQTAVGSHEAVQGVTVAAELPGKVVRIDFQPGAWVEKGALLIEQDTSTERAQLPGAQAAVELTRLNRKRMKELLVQKIVSQSECDSTEASFRQAVAQVDNIRSLIAKKTIRAPFAGRLGVRMVNLGQILSEGDEIVSLQALDPIFVNFLLPQQHLAQIRPGLTLRVTIEGLPEQVVEGTITAINPEVDAATRNMRIQGTLANPREQLRPGMYVNVAVVLPAPKQVLTIPATAALYAPYSDSVFVVEEQRDEQTGQQSRTVRQQFVRLGEKRGDFIGIESGLKEGETVVSTGVFKLRNGQSVVVDNSLAPDFKLSPKPEDN